MTKKNKIKYGIICVKEDESENHVEKLDGKVQRGYFSPERLSGISFKIHNKHIADFYVMLAGNKIDPEKFFSNCVYAAIGDLDIAIKEIMKVSKKNITSTLLDRIEQNLTEEGEEKEKIFVEIDDDMPEL